MPLFTVFASRAFLLAGTFGRNGERGSWVPYFTCATLMLVIYLPMITWLSLWIGLSVRTRFQAILARPRCAHRLDGHHPAGGGRLE
ncbi:MAG: hypothetical protein WDN28_22505 [Chthoniobacter sp.]